MEPNFWFDSPTGHVAWSQKCLSECKGLCKRVGVNVPSSLQITGAHCPFKTFKSFKDIGQPFHSDRNRKDHFFLKHYLPHSPNDPATEDGTHGMIEEGYELTVCSEGDWVD